MNQFSVSNWSIDNASSCDILFCSSGSESRCTHVAKKIAAKVKSVAWVYSGDVGAVSAANRAWFSKRGFLLYSSGANDDARPLIREIIKDGVARALKICVDISSMTRELMALWVYEGLCWHSADAQKLEIDFIYSHAEYSDPPASVGLVDKPTAIIPEFAGYFSNPTDPIMMIMGLGYEPHLALSFLEFLEPQRIVIFRPSHHDIRYTVAIDRINKVFMRFAKNSPSIHYDVHAPFALFQDIESVISGNVNGGRIHIAPYGLKLFVISSLLAAAMHYPNVMIWHLNGQRQSADLPNRIATGKMSGLRVQVNS